MIEFENVTFTYDGARKVLRDVNLRVRQGEFLCVLGGNGSGKSTLAKHMNALFTPDEGRVLVDGHDTADPACTYLVRSTAGMVFQNPDDQLVASLVENDVAFGPENLGVPTPELRKRVTRALADVGLVGFERSETAALSGGQKQRVAIAGVLAMEPRILILDEASSMLDPRGRAGLVRVCHELHEAGMTVVMITHFMDEAALADRVIVLKDGSVCLEGTPEDVLTRSDELEGLNLEAPFACELARDLRRRGFPVHATVDEQALACEIVAALDAPVDASGRGDTSERAGVSVRGSVSGRADVSAHGSASGRAGDAPSGGTATSAAPAKPASSERSGSAPLIEFDHVSFAYLTSAERRALKKRSRRTKAAEPSDGPAWGTRPDADWALRDVSFTVRESDFLGIAGHTGSGKSTLLQHMNGLLSPTEGHVLVGGEDLADRAAAARVRGRVGLVFQYPEHQLFAATVYEDVAFGPRNLGLSDAEVDARVRESLGLVGLDFDDVREKSPFALSGGQQRRVAFAGVLAMRPRTLILDEPVAGLDPAARADFLALIKGLHERGLTIVMVSHDMDDLANLSTWMIVLKEGGIFASGTPKDVFARGPELHDIGLGVPAPQRFAGMLREAGVPLRSDVLYDRDLLADALAALARRAS